MDILVGILWLYSVMVPSLEMGKLAHYVSFVWLLTAIRAVLGTALLDDEKPEMNTMSLF